MKKLFSLMLALMMFALPALAETDVGVIGGADGPTAILLNTDFVTAESLAEDAVAAGRRVTVELSLPEFSGFSIKELMGIDAETAGADAMAQFESINQAIADLVGAIGLTGFTQGDESGIGLSISGKEVLTFAAALTGENAYVRSNLLGGTVVLSESDVEPLILRVIDMLAMMGAFPEEDAATMKEQVPQLIEQFKTMLAESAGAVLTDEDVANLNFTAIENCAAALAPQVENLEQIIVPRMCDPAASGVRLSINNEEFISILKALVQFVRDNPKLMDYIGAQMEFPTEESITQQWAMYGELYKQFGMFEDEAAFRAANKTFPEMLDELDEMLDTYKALDGEFVTAVYFNEADEVVYLTSTMPLFEEDETLLEKDAAAEAAGTTQIINAVYIRQTLPEGVSHVGNISVDEEEISFDVLVKDHAAEIVVSARGVVFSDTTESKPLLTISAAEENGVVKGSFASNQESEPYFSGSFSFGYDADAEKLTTDFTVDVDVTFAKHEIGVVVIENPSEPSASAVPDVTAEAETPAELEKSEPVTNHISFSFAADYVRNGVDFSGQEEMKFGFNGFSVTLKGKTETTDPVESIMAGNVTRPTELDDASFANWFVGVYTSLYGWIGQMMQALPESVLALFTGMM